MKRIYVQNGIVFFMGIRLAIWEMGKQFIDCMFQKEEAWVSLWKELGFLEHVFVRVCMTSCRREVVSKRQRRPASGKGGGLEIYQLGQDSPIMMRFISLAERKKERV